MFKHLYLTCKRICTIIRVEHSSKRKKHFVGETIVSIFWRNEDTRKRQQYVWWLHNTNNSSSKAINSYLLGAKILGEENVEVIKILKEEK